MPSNFFTNLGLEISRELVAPTGRYGNDAASRTRLRQVADRVLVQHIGKLPPTAKDAAMPRPMRPRLSADQEEDMPPRGGPNKGNGGGNGAFAFGNGRNGDQEPMQPPDANGCMQFIRLLLAKLPPDQKSECMMQLAEMVSQEGADSGDYNGRNGSGAVPGNNEQALDRLGRKGARDTGTRKPAMDANIRALNHKSFLNRFPDAGKVSTWGKY